MPDPLRGDHLMDPDTSARRRASGPLGTAFKVTLGVALALLLVLAVLVALAALLLFPGQS